jgi:hypothetical protein
MIAYTYSIKHLPSNTYYYGVRKSSIEDIGITYFSSSKLVKRILEQNPLDDFEFKVRKRFDSYAKARIHETKFLQRINAVSNPRILNQAISSPRICSKDSVEELKRRESISKRMKELWNSDEYKNNQPFNKLSHEERVIRGKAGALKRAENYSSGKTIKKPKLKPTYKDVEISKNGEIKIVKANQVPAYVKGGWQRMPLKGL